MLKQYSNMEEAVQTRVHETRVLLAPPCPRSTQDTSVPLLRLHFDDVSDCRSCCSDATGNRGGGGALIKVKVPCLQLDVTLCTCSSGQRIIPAEGAGTFG